MVSDSPHDLARAEQRIARILAAKDRDALPYLRRKGRARFLRELQADGLPLAAAVAIIDRHEARLSSEELDHRVALIYRDAYERGEPPTLAVSQHFRVPHSTAGRWVSIARNEYGLLPKTRRGKARVRTTGRKSE